jgi:UrcA family protein
MQRSATILALAACVTFGLMAAAPASAAQFEPNSQRVSFADLNLDNEAGAQAMLRRIDRAAHMVCDDRAGARLLSDRRIARQCVAETKRNAVSELNHPMVSALFYGREPNIIVASR